MLVQTAVNRKTPYDMMVRPMGVPSHSRPTAMFGATVPFVRNAEIYGDKEDAEYLYKVVSGSVRTYKVLTDGRRQIGAFYLTGDVFGLEGDDKHTFSAEAVADCLVVVIKRRALVARASRDLDIARMLWTITAAELQRTHGSRHVADQDGRGACGGFPLGYGCAVTGWRRSRVADAAPGYS